MYFDAISNDEASLSFVAAYMFRAIVQISINIAFYITNGEHTGQKCSQGLP